MRMHRKVWVWYGAWWAVQLYNSQWPNDTYFGNRTGDPQWNGRQALLHHDKGGDMSEWPADLRVREELGA